MYGVVAEENAIEVDEKRTKHFLVDFLELTTFGVVK